MPMKMLLGQQLTKNDRKQINSVLYLLLLLIERLIKKLLLLLIKRNIQSEINKVTLGLL